MGSYLPCHCSCRLAGDKCVHFSSARGFIKDLVAYLLSWSYVIAPNAMPCPRLSTLLLTKYWTRKCCTEFPYQNKSTPVRVRRESVGHLEPGVKSGKAKVPNQQSSLSSSKTGSPKSLISISSNKFVCSSKRNSFDKQAPPVFSRKENELETELVCRIALLQTLQRYLEDISNHMNDAKIISQCDSRNHKNNYLHQNLSSAFVKQTCTPFSSIYQPQCSNHARLYSTCSFHSKCLSYSSSCQNQRNQSCVQTPFIQNIYNANVNLVRHFTKTVNIREEEVVKSSDIQKFLAEHGVKFEQGFTCYMTSCPQTTRKKGTPNWERLYINMTTGHFSCGTCGKIGGWLELKDHISLLAKSKKRKDYECFKDVESVCRVDVDMSKVTEAWTGIQSVKNLSENELFQLQEDLDCQEINKSTLDKFGVGYNPETRTVMFAYQNPESEMVGLKRITCKLTENEISRTLRETLVPRSGIYGLFGWSTVNLDTAEVVLTTSETNAMAVYQETKVPSLSLPKGYTVLSQEVLPSLERFKKVLLWFGDDIRAWEAAKQFAKKLNTNRCFVIRPTVADPSPFTALKQGLRLKNILSKAKPISHKSIVSFSQLRQEVFSELAHVEQVAGVKWRRYPVLNRLLKGHRRGELTVFTGPTGSGKTTFMSDYSLDLCMQGVNTLWGSFEINNVRLGKMMLTQYAMKNLSKHLDEFDTWANQFEELPIFFMTFHGQESIRRVIETMSHAVYVHDIAHVVVDNLQFMMGVDGGEWANRFTRQDMIISAFRRFATSMNCHVSLVIHPRKEKDTEELTTASIFGSAKASQEADNVMLLQDKRLSSLRGRKYIQITKNRFDGELGIMLLKFDKESLSFAVKDKPKKVETKKTEDILPDGGEDYYPEM